MRSSGCLGLVVMLLAASVATALTAVSVILFLSFAALSFESWMGIETILRTVVALIAGYFFVRVGLGVWRDLKKSRTPSKPTAENEGSGGENL
jgi:hypothetical protein